jgi:hypothetical protein
MLAWVEHPAAAQLLLAVAGGFRTPSIQEEAARQAESLAERHHCTVAGLVNLLKEGNRLETQSEVCSGGL